MSSAPPSRHDLVATRFTLVVIVVLLVMSLGAARTIDGARPASPPEFQSWLSITQMLAARFLPLVLGVWLIGGRRAAAEAGRVFGVALALVYGPHVVAIEFARASTAGFVEMRSTFAGLECDIVADILGALTVAATLPWILGASARASPARVLPERPLRAAALGVVVTGLLAVLVFVIAGVTMLPLLGGPANVNVATDPDALRLALLSLTSRLLHAPVVEELVFRGFVQRRLRPLMPTWASVLVSALAFAFAHDTVTLVRVCVGLLLALLYERTQSLLLPILAHSGANIANSAAALGRYFALGH